MKKVLPIAQALYFGYSILFIFDNATNYSVYAKNALYAYKMNKRSGEKQVMFCNSWYIDQIDIYYI